MNDYNRRFRGRCVIVTGGNSGIRKATSLRFAREGASVAIVARNANTGRAVVEEIRAFGGQASFHEADVADPRQIDSACNVIFEQNDRVDMAFNNAGAAGGVCAFDAVSAGEFDTVLQTNLYGVFHSMKAQIRHFLARGKDAAIVNCASISGLVGVPYQAAYCASKHAVVGLTKSVALEYAKRGIRINAVCPGGVATPMLKDYLRRLPKANADALSPAPIGRLSAPDEVAGLVTWLCSADASYVVGQAFAIDGGYTTR